MDYTSGLIGLLGAIIGAGSSIWISYINNNKSYKLQTDLENLKRRNELNDLQRNTLLEIQGLLDLIIIKSLELIKINLDYYSTNKTWIIYDVFNPTPEYKQFNEIENRFYRLVVRIKNENLRNGLEGLIGNISKAIESENRDEMKERLKKVEQDDLRKWNELLGDEIRKTY